MIAVDDSHSMSESGCGDVALEALVTVCRAVSQLEMGSLAVASFGTKGNIKLLHDFDRPFSGEAGVKVSRINMKSICFLSTLVCCVYLLYLCEDLTVYFD